MPATQTYVKPQKKKQWIKKTSIRCSHPNCSFTLPYAPQTYESRLMKKVMVPSHHNYKESVAQYFCKSSHDLEKAIAQLEDDLCDQSERLAEVMPLAEKMLQTSRDCYSSFKYWKKNLLDVMDVVKELDKHSTGLKTLEEKEVEDLEFFLSRQKGFLVQAVEEVMKNHQDQGGVDPVPRVLGVIRRLKYESRQRYKEEQAAAAKKKTQTIIK